MTSKILLARFKLNFDALKGIKVAIFDFPYEAALDEFLAGIVQINPQRARKNDRKIEYKEYPPIRRLNDVLVGSAPILVHGFEEYAQFTHTWEKSHLKTRARRMLALATDGLGVPVWRPSSEQINDLAAVWAANWALNTFQEEIAMRGGEELLEALDSQIRSVQAHWHEMDASELWDSKENGIVWDALPSVISTVFVERTTHQPFRLGNDHDRRDIQWRLTQDGDKHLAVINEPFYFEHGSKRGLISYKLEFVVQTQAVQPEPWIAVYIRVRRWADSPISQKNFRRDVSVMLTMGSERKAGWQVAPTMIRLKVTGGIGNLRWQNDTPSLLEAWNVRALPDPNDLFTNPAQFATPDNFGDTYHILHAEGMEYNKRQGHIAKSGTSLRERADIMQHISAIMITDQEQKDTTNVVLETDTFLEVDELATLDIDTILEKQLISMFTFDDLHKRGARAIPVSSRIGTAEKRRQIAHRMIMDALDRARGGKPLNFMLISKETPAKDVLEMELRKFLFLGDGEPFPDSIKITRVVTPLELNNPPGRKIPPSRPVKECKEHQQTLEAEWQGKVSEWQGLLRENIDPAAHNLAFIEMDGSMAKATEKDDWLKSAIRHACVQQRVLSQMVFTIPKGITEGKPYVPDRSRIQNAVRDLLLRQLHVMYGPPSHIYQYAGLGEDVAKSLVIIGLYHHKSNTPSVDYPLAVELHPDGSVFVILPDETGNATTPIPYIEAGVKIGQLFARPMTDENKKRINYYPKKSDTRLQTFVEQILKRHRDRPQLVLMEADGWRSQGIASIGNETIKSGMIKVKNTTYRSADLPNLRILRVRDTGNLGETPQYMATDNERWDELDEIDDLDLMIGVPDTSVESDLLHYFSIGRQLRAAGEQDNELYSFNEGGDTAYKHQQAVEFVPFFLQQGDDPLIYCRIAHFLRSSPAWEGGNIVLSYPLHLARTLVKDQLDVFKPEIC